MLAGEFFLNLSPTISKIPLGNQDSAIGSPVLPGGIGQLSNPFGNVDCIRNPWEGEVPAELGTPWFGRSLTLPIPKC